MADDFYDRDDSHYFTNSLAARGISHREQNTKMRNLQKLGFVVLVALSHECYLVNGDQLYSPYTDVWFTLIHV